MLWQNALFIGFACIVCGYMGTLGFWSALVVSPFTIVLARFGGFYAEMDLTGWSMLIAPTASAFLAAALATAWRKRHPPEPDFVAPPPPGRRRTRTSRASGDAFELYGARKPPASGDEPDRQ
ncbi:MAG: hypothetical protein HY834_07350 [Devosia nanyangense]|uniref:Uncharacterized protein n=1 Tax=Devosia nanyangense TaxID=1228055 RepID=A0A933L3D2_9HYPH|nr:hypothetical protein [Devosia nanyangense]